LSSSCSGEANSSLARNRHGPAVAAEGDAPVGRLDKRRGNLAVEGLAEEGVVSGFGLSSVAFVRIVRRPGFPGEDAMKGCFPGVGGFLNVVLHVTAVVRDRGT